MAMNLFLTAALTAAIAGQNFYCADIKRQEDYAIVVQQQEEAARLKAEQEKQAQEAKKPKKKKRTLSKMHLNLIRLNKIPSLLDIMKPKAGGLKEILPISRQQHRGILPYKTMMPIILAM